MSLGGKSWSLVKPLWQVAEAHGLERERLATVLDCAPTDDQASIPIGRVFSLWAHTAAATRDEALPFRAAASCDLAALGPLSLVGAGLAPGYAAFAEAMRWLPLVVSSGRWHTEAHGGLVHLSWIRGGERWLGHRLANESGVAQLVACLRQVYGAAFTPSAVFFRHAAPPRTAAHRAFFRAPVAFGDAVDGLTFPLASLVPREPPSPARFRGIAAANDAALAALREAPGSLTREVRLALDHRLGASSANTGSDGEMRVGERHIARALGLSERSLRRKLAGEGAQFRKLLADARRDTAHVWLSCTNVPLIDVALRTGFADAAAFSHAVRRWFGKSPRELRAAAKTAVRAS